MPQIKHQVFKYRFSQMSSQVNNPYVHSESTRELVSIMGPNPNSSSSANKPPYFADHNPPNQKVSQNLSQPSNPYFNAPPPPRPSPSAQYAINIYNQRIMLGPCQFCHSNVGVIDHMKPGCAAFCWCVTLGCLGGGCCLFIPFIMPDCQDHEIRCINCNGIRAYVRSTYCCYCDENQKAQQYSTSPDPHKS